MRSSRSPTTCLVDNSKKRKVLKYGAGVQSSSRTRQVIAVATGQPVDMRHERARFDMFHERDKGRSKSDYCRGLTLMPIMYIM